MSALSEQQDYIPYMQGAAGAGATANGNGAAAIVSGYLGAQQVEIIETAGGTATVTLQGSIDGVIWYGCGFQRVDATASPARSVSAISVGANSSHIYQILDPYVQIRAVISSIAGGAAVIVRAYLVPA